ncbi:MAG: glycoside hydrolase family 3 N-terminal domain-containing protein [Christensenellales bacterium]
MRGSEDEILSERALRELYLKPFEKVVKEGIVRYIMTSYNAINGYYNCSNYDLTTTILRGEWGYEGAVMTDWWANPKDAITGERSRYTLAEMVRAQNDLFMVVPDAAAYRDNIVARINDGTLTLGELQRCARNILRVILASNRLKNRDYGYKPEAIPDELLYEGDYEDKDLDVPLPSDGDYCAVIKYRADGDELTQYQLTVRINELLGVILGSYRYGQGRKHGKIHRYVSRESEIRFEGTPRFRTSKFTRLKDSAMKNKDIKSSQNKYKINPIIHGWIDDVDLVLDAVEDFGFGGVVTNVPGKDGFTSNPDNVKSFPS